MNLAKLGVRLDKPHLHTESYLTETKNDNAQNNISFNSSWRSYLF